MADYAISNVPRRVVYAASGVGPYAFTFEILVNTDVAVYKDDALLTLTTDYTVTIAANGTGSITLTASPTGATQIAIVGSRAVQRTSDFVTGGDFFANTVNNELDSLTIFAQQNAEAVSRALRAPQTDPTNIDMTLPRASVRANKTLAFDSNGDPTTGEVIGDNRGNWASGTAYNKRDIVKDTSNGNVYYANTSHTSSGSQPISTNADSAKWDLLVDNASAGASATAAASSATAAAGSASAASTSATNAASSASAAASSASNAATSASNAASSATSAANSASAAAASAASINPADIVHISGTETITGAKTFSQTITGSITGNAGTATNGVVTTGSYADPAWITSLAGSKVSGNISGNAANVTGTVAIANGGTGSTTASAARIALGVAIGTNVQAWAADLDTWATKTAPSGTVVGTSDTQTLTNKTLTSPTLTTPNINSAQFATVTGTAPIYPCRAWVNFNGTGTVAIRASGNVSSITDNGTGDYTVNFTTAMPDENYAFTVGFNNDNNSYPRVFGTYANTPTASGIRLRIAYTASFGTQVFEDLDRFCVAIHR